MSIWMRHNLKTSPMANADVQKTPGELGLVLHEVTEEAGSSCDEQDFWAKNPGRGNYGTRDERIQGTEGKPRAKKVKVSMESAGRTHRVRERNCLGKS